MLYVLIRRFAKIDSLPAAGPASRSKKKRAQDGGIPLCRIEIALQVFILGFTFCGSIREIQQSTFILFVLMPASNKTPTHDGWRPEKAP